MGVKRSRRVFAAMQIRAETDERSYAVFCQYTFLVEQPPERSKLQGQHIFLHLKRVLTAGSEVILLPISSNNCATSFKERLLSASVSYSSNSSRAWSEWSGDKSLEEAHRDQYLHNVVFGHGNALFDSSNCDQGQALQRVELSSTYP